MAGKTGSVQLSFTTDVYKYAVFYAVCAEQNKYGQLQNYMCDTDPTVTMRLRPFVEVYDILLRVVDRGYLVGGRYGRPAGRRDF